MRCEMDALVRCLFWIVLIRYSRQDTSLRRLMDWAALCVVAIVLALVLIVCVDFTAAQEGYLGHSHDKWHQGFYSTLNRPDGKGSCCLMDCRLQQAATKSRKMVVTRSDGKVIKGRRRRRRAHRAPTPTIYPVFCGHAVGDVKPC